jgi:BASS family bile acid:Na+ symporter
MTTVVAALLVALALVSTVGAGLELDPRRLRDGALLKMPLATALLANVVVLPLGTYLLLRALPVSADTTTALWLIALAPGGASSPLLARLAGGEPTRVGAIYVALCLATLVVLPLLLPSVVEVRGGSGMLLALTIGLQLLPLAVGLIVRLRNEALATRQAALLRRLGSVLLGVVVLLLVVSRGSFLATLDVYTTLSMLALVLLSLGAGAVLAPKPRLPDALLTCVRNLTLALLLAEAAMPGGRATLLIAAYGLVMYVSAALCLRLFKLGGPVAQEIT